jgi:YHS domain-containing protein
MRSTRLRALVDDDREDTQMRNTVSVLLMIATLSTGAIAAHNSGHQTAGQAAVPGAPPDAQLVNACVQSQQQAATLAERLNRRLELARQTNSPADMRAAMDDLQAALGEMRSALQQCDPVRAAVAAAAPMDHSKMAMGGAAPAAAAAAMDHSKMAMPGAAPAVKPGTRAASKPAAAAAPMDHSKMAMPGTATGASGEAPIKMETPKLPVLAPERIADPACPKNVTDPKAPKAVYQRKVYYFCSIADRDQFRKGPAAYLKRRPR